jgi:hypothetical protein
MRKVTGLVLLGALMAPLSMAQATEVTRLPANNTFASATANTPDASTSVFVTREKTNKGGPVDRIFFISFHMNGNFYFGSGVLPQGAFHWSANGSSLNVDTDDITYDSEFGVPAGVISVDWEATDVSRDSGSTKIDAGPNMHVQIVGTRTATQANITGSVVGDSVDGAMGEVDRIVQAVIIVTKD